MKYHLTSASVKEHKQVLSVTEVRLSFFFFFAVNADNCKVSLILLCFFKLSADLKVNCHPIRCKRTLLSGHNALVCADIEVKV